MKRCAELKGPGLSKKMMKRMPRGRTIPLLVTHSFERNGHEVFPLNPSFDSLVGFSADDFYPLKEIVTTKVEMQEELAEAIKGQKGRLTQRAIKKRIRKCQPTANHLALFFST